MSSQRHVLRRFEPDRGQAFDEQFWPVAIALCVLAALTVGTILTMLRGPWMWGSLLAIPILVGLGLLVLSYVEERWWRRSIQVALLLSLAIHLFVMIVAYQTEIFRGRNPARVAQTERPSPIEQLEISVAQTEAIWNQPNPIETPPIEVITERQNQPAPTPTQPVREPTADVKVHQPNPPIERRESKSEIAPQSGRSLSEKSRRDEASSRQSRELNVATAAPTSPTARSESQTQAPSEQVNPQRRSATDGEPKTISRRQVTPATSELAQSRSPTRREERPAESAVAAARQPRRTSQIEPEPTDAPRQPPRPSNKESEAEQASRDLPAADVAAARRQVSPSLTRSAEDNAPNSPTERQPERSQKTQIADAMAAPEVASSAQRPRQSRAPTESSTAEKGTPTSPIVERFVQPSPESAQVSRQQTLDDQWMTHSNPSERMEQSPTDQSPRQVQRRAVTADRPSDVPTSGAQPRLARDPSPLPTTSEALESPAVVAANGQPTPSLVEAKPLALERAVGGVSGLGATPNFGRAADSAASPAQIASDSARREQIESQSTVAQTLSPSQATKVSRSTAGIESPQASLPTATAVAADRAAGNDPQPLHASAAASVTSALAAGRRSEISADVGTADLDIGSTKIVSGAARSDSAGGGQPELSAERPSASRIASRDGTAQPSIVAEVMADSVAANPTDASGEPPNQQAQPNAAARVVQKRGGATPRSQGPSRGESAGEPSEFSSADQQSRQSVSRDSRRSNRGSEGDESVADDQSADLRRAVVARQASVDGLAAAGQPRGLAQRSTAEQTSDESEAARSDMPRSNRSGDSLGASSPTKAQSDDGFSGDSSLASSSLQRRSENAPDGGGDTPPLASSADRSSQNHQLEIASGSDGSEFARGMAQNVEPGNDESSPQSLKSERATGSGVESVGPSTRRNMTTAATAELLVDGSGRAESNSENESAPQSNSTQSRRNNRTELVADASAALAGPESKSAGAAANPNRNNDRVSQAKRTEAAQARVEIDWDEGAGGLGQRPEPEIGIASRQSSPSSDVVAFEPTTRFHRRNASGQLAVSPSAPAAQVAFKSRNPGSLGRSGPQTEQAIERGLAFLIRHQQADGHWSLLGFDNGQASQQFQLDSDTAATGLALLAFQGAGYTHREFKYADRLNRAVAWLVRHQRSDGNLYIDSDQLSNNNCQLYSHGIAALALAEAYGMTQDPEVRVAAQKAIDFIVATQDDQLGGWRYLSTPGQRSTDTSVTGWMVMALHSGRLAGLDVDPKVWTGVNRWLETAQVPDSESQFVYSPLVQDDPSRKIIRGHLRQAANSTTAIGLLMRMYTGWAQDDPRLLEGANILLKQLPSEFNRDVRDTYYWYYATQVLRHVDGPIWQAWNGVLHPLLISSQVADGELAGSWSPIEPVEDKWGRFGGRLYVTTLNLLSLEVDYRLLPLYEKTVAPRKNAD